ncbi:hypothetical protein VDGL01_04586 [Verticillium dahliae]
MDDIKVETSEPDGVNVRRPVASRNQPLSDRVRSLVPWTSDTTEQNGAGRAAVNSLIRRGLACRSRHHHRHFSNPGSQPCCCWRVAAAHTRFATLVRVGWRGEVG